jgi:spore coat polysaccharide biosynthesis predicted glycosyltransferase SpsG
VPRVVAVADAGREAGLGHVSRSSAIAVALRAEGVETTCYAYGADAPFERDGVAWSPLAGSRVPVSSGHVVLIDTYRLPPEVLEQTAASNALVLLHDQGPVPERAALVVTTAGHSVDAGIPLLAGLEYAALRPAFWDLPPRELRPAVEEVLVTVGSGALADVGVELARSVADALPEVRVTLVRGPYAGGAALRGIAVLDAPESLLEPLLTSDVVVTAGGQTMLEAAAAGTPCIAVALVSNQRGQAERLAELHAVELVDPPDPSAVAAAVTELARSVEARRTLSSNAQRAIDGHGAMRVASRIARLAEGSRPER